MPNMDFSYRNNKGKRVSGAAAFAHYVFTEKGGIQEYNDEIGMEYIKAFVKQNSDDINNGIIRKAKRKLFKVI